MKKILSLFALLTLLLALSSCLVPMDTEPSDGFPSVTFPPDTSEDAPPITYLYGNWRTDEGVSEPIDERTVNGSPYTVKEIRRESNGDITATLVVDNSDVVYTVYRYKTGYAEYSYMEALFTAKNITFKFSK